MLGKSIDSVPVPALAFAAFVFWLTSVPMGGALADMQGALLWFLLPHIAGLLLLALRGSARLFQRLLPIGLLSCAIGTIIQPFFLPATATPLLFVILGLAAAPLSVFMGILLRTAGQPLLSAAAGLAIGNLLTTGLMLLQPDGGLWPLLSGLALLPILFWTRPAATLPEVNQPTPGLMRYLPFIFFFQLISGLMYAGLLPAYLGAAYLPGLETGFYITAVLLAAYLMRPRKDIMLMGGAMAAMLGVILWEVVATPLGENLALYLLMGAFGIIDLVLLAHVLSFANQRRAYGLGFATLCVGIAGGELLLQFSGQWSVATGFTGLIVLNLALAALYLLGRSQTESPSAQAPTDTVSAPSSIRKDLLPLLSAQEREVLENVIEGKTYRAIAAELSVSESTVKTYMQRIYKKTGAYRREQLVRLVTPEDPLDRPQSV